ncbi:ribonuclease hii [hydrocarbon metagenome]|uniref:Ribonuclease HII n=1 Tax=hydrocarbon metagenome TaxID=938273 RepID=A0A0W8FHC9_9ZZZZ|nr:ribonuclease HII [Methanomicrobiaceae archaeon]
MICGVDEAGKGAVLGPLVVAAVGCRALVELEALPVRDSKALSPRQRERLAAAIGERCAVRTIAIDAAGIDAARQRTGLNEYMAEVHARALAGLRPKSAYIDACDVDPVRYGRRVGGHLDFPCLIRSEHRADETYKIVGAASIVAKVCRDRIIADLREEYGEIGSGYPSDPATIRFLREYIEAHRTPPACARRSWKTVANLLCRQTGLLDFQ